MLLGFGLTVSGADCRCGTEPGSGWVSEPDRESAGGLYIHTGHAAGWAPAARRAAYLEK